MPAQNFKRRLLGFESLERRTVFAVICPALVGMDVNDVGPVCRFEGAGPANVLANPVDREMWAEELYETVGSAIDATAPVAVGVHQQTEAYLLTPSHIGLPVANGALLDPTEDTLAIGSLPDADKQGSDPPSVDRQPQAETPSFDVALPAAAPTDPYLVAFPPEGSVYLLCYGASGDNESWAADRSLDDF